MNANVQPVVVRRVHRVSATGSVGTEQAAPSKGQYRGFCSIPGETLDQFHNRMFDLPALEAMAYEMEVALEHGKTN